MLTGFSQPPITNQTGDNIMADFRRIRISVINNRPGLNGVQDEIEITSKDRKTLRGRRKYAQQCADKMNAEDPKKNWIVLEWRE